MVRSADGTQIGFAKVGSGPAALIIVHGALNTADDWLPVATAMAEHCTCYVMDRRGRGRSDDGADYSFDREIEDIKAILDGTGSGAYLLGHSSGAIYALEAARRFPVAGLMLYEPPLHLRRRFQGIFDRIRLLAKEQRFDEAVTVFFKEEVELPEDQLSAMQTTPLWSQMVMLAPTAVREWEALLQVKPTVEQYGEVSVPTLLLSGSETEDHPSFATKELEATLPNARKVMLDGQGHSANRSAPDLVAEELANFVLETS